MPILTVRQLTALIREAVESGFPYVWVRGEVTNLSRPASGHVYFSLKDDNAQLQAVWFKGDQKEQERFDPLTGEVFEDGPRTSLAGSLRNGQQVICAGRLTVYAPRGGYQLIVELAQDSGEGQLFLELEALKKKLEAQGYFRLERKRTLPEHPHRVCVLTAPTGAAIQDFLRLAGERGFGAAIEIRPVPVQGDEAPARIVAALEAENRRGWAEVVALIRGGGSLQDLWAFNDERVADAVFASRIPVIAGIGHEVDTSLTDMTADVRAATPSHAAQILWPERRWYAQLVDDLENTAHEATEKRIAAAEAHLLRLERALNWLSPERELRRIEERFLDLQRRLGKALHSRLDIAEATLSLQESRMCRSPWPLAMETTHRALETLEHRLGTCGKTLATDKSVSLGALDWRLHDALRCRMEYLDRTLEHQALRLRANDPLAPLERGYACAFTADGRLVRGIQDAPPGASLTVKLRDGEFDSLVTAARAAGEEHEPV